MRVINFFNLAVVLIAAFFTWNAVAASGTNVHILENLSSQESKELRQSLEKMGYKTSKKSLFSESHDAIIITKALKTEYEEASISIEMVHLENEKSIPHSIFKYKVDGNDLQAMIGALPRPEAFVQDAVRPVAFQSMER